MELLCCRLADGRNLRIAERADILACGKEPLHEAFDAVRAREDQPLIRVELRDGRIDGRIAVIGRGDCDSRLLDDAGAELFEAGRELRGLAARARDEHRLAKERLLAQLVEPLQLAAQLDDLADDEDGRGLQSRLLDIFGDLADRRHKDLLLRLRAPANDGSRRIGRTAIRDELRRDVRQIGHAHEEDERVDACRELVPADVALALRRVFMAGDDGERRRDAAVRDGDAGIGRHRDGRRDARHDLERQAVLLEQQPLLAAAAEDKRVAALEAHDRLALFCLIDEQLVDVRLLHRVVARGLADVDELRIARRPAEDAVIREAVVDDNLGLLQAIHCLEADEAVVPRTRPDQIYHTCHNKTLLLSNDWTIVSAPDLRHALRSSSSPISCRIAMPPIASSLSARAVPSDSASAALPTAASR